MDTTLLVGAAAFGIGCLIGSMANRQSGDADRLRRLERKLNLLLDNLGVKDLPVLSMEVQELARDPGRKIAAIKLHREQTGCELIEAKQGVEDFILNQNLKS